MPNAAGQLNGKDVTLADMWIELPYLWIAVINTLGITAAHFLLAWGCTQLPQCWFRKDEEARDSDHRFQRWLYERVFLVKRWKKRLPDAAPWFKGFPKSSMQSSEPDYLRTFIAETRRGELSHWLQIPAISAFIIWTPWPGNLIIIIYAFLSNLPCIINLRHTRQRMSRLLFRLTRSP
jgi:hypothetical protein